MPSDFFRNTVAATEDLVTNVAQGFVRSLAAARKLQPLHLGLAVPGLCHAHNPSLRLDPACAFCRRAGNVFAPGPEWRGAPMADGGSTDGPDLVKRYQIPILELLVDFADELLDTVHETKGVDVEDVRTKMLDALRIHIRSAKADDGAEGGAEGGAERGAEDGEDGQDGQDGQDEALIDEALFDFLPRSTTLIPTV